MAGIIQLPTAGIVSGLQNNQDANAALAALATFLSSASAPTTTSTGLSSTAGVVWHDTASNKIKIRDQGDSTWITALVLDETNKWVIPQLGGGTASIASATTTDIGVVPQAVISVTGTTTISSFGTSAIPGTLKVLTFGGALTLTNGASLVLPTGANILTATNDCAIFQYLGGVNHVWQCVSYVPATAGATLLDTAASVASAATVNAGQVPSRYLTITGTTTISSLGTAPAGVWRFFRFAGALTLTNSASLIVPTGANLAVAVGDTCTVMSEGSGIWRIIGYQRAAGAPLNIGTSTAFGGATGTDLQVSSLSLSHSGGTVTLNYTVAAVSNCDCTTLCGC